MKNYKIIILSLLVQLTFAMEPDLQKKDKQYQAIYVNSDFGALRCSRGTTFENCAEDDCDNTNSSGSDSSFDPTIVTLIPDIPPFTGNKISPKEDIEAEEEKILEESNKALPKNFRTERLKKTHRTSKSLPGGFFTGIGRKMDNFANKVRSPRGSPKKMRKSPVSARRNTKQDIQFNRLQTSKSSRVLRVRNLFTPRGSPRRRRRNQSLQEENVDKNPLPGLISSESLSQKLQVVQKTAEKEDTQTQFLVFLVMSAKKITQRLNDLLEKGADPIETISLEKEEILGKMGASKIARRRRNKMINALDIVYIQNKASILKKLKKHSMERVKKEILTANRKRLPQIKKLLKKFFFSLCCGHPDINEFLYYVVNNVEEGVCCTELVKFHVVELGANPNYKKFNTTNTVYDIAVKKNKFLLANLLKGLGVVTSQEEKKYYFSIVNQITETDRVDKQIKLSIESLFPQGLLYYKRKFVMELIANFNIIDEECITCLADINTKDPVFNFSFIGTNGDTPLSLAGRWGRAPVVEFLLKQLCVEVDQKTGEGITSLRTWVNLLFEGKSIEKLRLVGKEAPKIQKSLIALRAGRNKGCKLIEQQHRKCKMENVEKCKKVLAKFIREKGAGKKKTKGKEPV